MTEQETIPQSVRWFWMGKSPKVKMATEFYIKKIDTCDWVPQKKVAEMFGVTEFAIRLKLRLIEEDPELMEFYFKHRKDKRGERITTNKVCYLR